MAFQGEAFQLYVEQERERFIAELGQLVSFASVAAERRDIVPCADWLCEKLRRIGAQAEQVSAIEGRSPLIIGEIGQGERSLLIYNHYDVQPADPLPEWNTPPFEMTRRDGLLIGRGTGDDKGELLSRIHGIEAWLATQGTLPIKLKFIFEGEEETDSLNLSTWVKQNHNHPALVADGLLWEGAGYDTEGVYTLMEGCKGNAYFELRATGANRDLHSSIAPIVPNPAWRLVWALATLKNAQDEITLDGYHEYIWDAGAERLAQIDALPFDGEQRLKDLGLKAWLGNVEHAEANRRWMLNPTMTICGFDSGYAGEGVKTVLPHRARVKLDFRLVPHLTPQIIAELLRLHLDQRGFSDIEIVYLGGDPPSMRSGKSLVQTAAIAAYELALGVRPVVAPWMTGSGPMYWLSDFIDLPVISAGATWHPNRRVHAPNENILEADYFKAVRLMGGLIQTFSEVEHP